MRAGQRPTRPLRLRRASAYFRLGAKAERAGNWSQAAHFRQLAERLVEEERRNREYLAARGGAR